VVLAPCAKAALERANAFARLIDDEAGLDLGAEELAVVGDRKRRMDGEKALSALARAADDRTVANRHPAVNQPFEFLPWFVQLIEEERAEL
jgi:hypothetical protein